MLAQK